MHRRYASLTLFANAAAAVILWLGVYVPSTPSVQAAVSQAAPAAETYAELPGVRLWYKDTGGNGVPVVFMHAATGSSRSWENQIPAFTKAGYRFIAFDRRGVDRTVVDPTNPKSGTDADDLQALMDYLHINRFHLVSTAAGGFASLDYAVSFQQRLRSLVIANSIGSIQDPAFSEMTLRMRPPQWESLPVDFQELGPSYRAANPEGTRRWLEIQQKYAAPLGRGAAAGRGTGAPAPQTRRNQVTFALLETLKVPTLLIAGDSDLIAPPPIMRLFGNHIKNSVFVTIPEAGHSAYWEQPEIFNRDVLEFIRKH